MVSPSNREVQIGRTLKDDEYIGMVRREVLDKHLRDTAAKNGATVINGLFMKMDMPQNEGEPYVLQYNDLGDQEGSARKGVRKTLEVDVVIGADGANSRVARIIDAGDYEYAIAFQERMRIDEGKMEYYKERAEMYVGEDVCRTSTRGCSRSTTTLPSALARWWTRRASRCTRRASASEPPRASRAGRSSASRPTRSRSTRARGARRAAAP